MEWVEQSSKQCSPPLQVRTHDPQLRRVGGGRALLDPHAGLRAIDALAASDRDPRPHARPVG